MLNRLFRLARFPRTNKLERIRPFFVFRQRSAPLLALIAIDCTVDIRLVPMTVFVVTELEILIECEIHREPKRARVEAETVVKHVVLRKKMTR